MDKLALRTTGSVGMHNEDDEVREIQRRRGKTESDPVQPGSSQFHDTGPVSSHSVPVPSGSADPVQNPAGTPGKPDLEYDKQTF